MYSLVISILLVLMPLAQIKAISPNSNEVDKIEELLRDDNGDGRLDRLGEKVTVRGRATVGADVFSDRYMILYMQDSAAGIMIFSDELDTSVSKGDSLHVTGTLTMHASKPEIVVEHLDVVGENSQILDPVPLNRAFEDPERYRGLLVSGKAVVQNGNTGSNTKMIQISSPSGSDDSLHVFVSRSNAYYEDFKFDALKAGDHIHISGILIRYTSDYTGDMLYQVLPRKQEDLIINNLQPELEKGSFIYADIDTTSGKVYVLLESGLWVYNLNNSSWRFLDALEDFEGTFSNYEFGFNAKADAIQLWSNGIGELYTMDPKTYNIKREDRSFNHQNQFGHYPFYRDSTLYAFGGYGFWENHNIIVYYNQSQHAWSIQNVNRNSSLPSRRTPATGVYEQDNEWLYIFGGHGTESGHSEDQNTLRREFQDIWRFSFKNQRWEKIMTLDKPKNNAILPSGVGKTNKQSSSFYLPEEHMWFIPFFNSKSQEDTFKLRPVHLASQEAKVGISLDFDSNDRFAPTNYFYNPNEKEVVFVGIYNRVNSDTYSVRTFRIPADSLMLKVSGKPFYASIQLYYYLFGLTLIGALLFWLYRDRNSGEKREEEQHEFINFRTLNQANWLNSKEERLINYMHEEERFMASHEIEELLWSNVESYDYRRRLRNDTIKSINKKFEQHYPQERSLILRKKDPDDNRRYLYGLSENILEG